MQNLIASSQHRLIIGLGVTGLSVARFFARANQPFSVVDSREAPAGVADFKRQYPNIHLGLGTLNFEDWGGVTQIIISPGVSRKEPAIQQAIKAGVEVIGDVELFARNVKAPIAAITGSNGKSTVTTLLGQMAKDTGINVAVCGNIGTPVLDALSDDVALYVVELSSFQLESTLALNARVATILNISADHMDRYDGLPEYLRAKQSIFFGADAVIFNRDDPLTHAPMANNVEYVSYGSSPADLKTWGMQRANAGQIIAFGSNEVVAIEALKIRGSHNALNVQAAFAMGKVLGLTIDSMANTAKAFAGLKHRCQFVATVEGVDYFNDSKGTNVGATIAAVKGLATGKNVILLAGGDGKGADFTPLKAAILDSVKTLITYGVDGPRIADQASGTCRLLEVETLDVAVQSAFSVQERGDVVVLSPACASFDMFKNYEMRGDHFIGCVEALCA